VELVDQHYYWLEINDWLITGSEHAEITLGKYDAHGVRPYFWVIGCDEGVTMNMIKILGEIEVPSYIKRKGVK